MGSYLITTSEYAIRVIDICDDRIISVISNCIDQFLCEVESLLDSKAHDLKDLPPFFITLIPGSWVNENGYSNQAVVNQGDYHILAAGSLVDEPDALRLWLAKLIGCLSLYVEGFFLLMPQSLKLDVGRIVQLVMEEE